MADKYTPQDLQDNLAYLNETKDLIKQAIIDKEQPVGEEDTFRSYADKIRAIETGIKTEDATATSSDILYPKTAYNTNGKVVGQLIPEYEMLDNAVSKPSPITNASGFNIIDIDFNTGLVILSENDLPTTGNITIGKFENNTITLTEHVFKLSDFEEDLTDLKFDDVAIAPILNEDDTVNIALTIKTDVGTRSIKVYCMKYDYHEYKIIEWASKSGIRAYFSGHDAYSSIEWLPNNSKYMLIGGQQCTSVITNHIMVWSYIDNVVSQHRNTGGVGDGCRRILVSDDGNYCIPCSGITNGGQIVKVEPTGSLVSIAGTVDSPACFYKDDYIIARDKIIKRNDLTTVVATLDYTGWVNTINSWENICMGDYFFCYNLNGFRYYRIDPSTFALTQEGTIGINARNNNAKLNTTRIFLKKSNKLIITDFNSNSTYIFTLTAQNKLKLLTIDNTKLIDTSGSTATSADILEGETAYSKDTKLTGTMPNNGIINIVPKDEDISIPGGYTSGGTVFAVNISSLNDYKTCLDISKNILDGSILNNDNLISPLDFTAAGNSTLTNSETTLIYKRGSNQYLNGAEANLELKVARKYRLSFNAESESQENIVIIYGTTEDVEYSYATGKEVKWSTSGYQQIEFITKQEDIQIYFSTHGSTFKQVTITDLTLYLID